MKFRKMTDAQNSNKLAQAFEEIVNQRRSVRVYDQEFDFDTEVVQRSLELATLSPNSSNMQLWEFYRIVDPETKAKMLPICMNQNSVKTANELVVAVTRHDKWKERAQFNVDTVGEMFGEDSKAYEKVKPYYKKLIPFTYSQDRLGLWGRIKKFGLNIGAWFRPMYREASRSDMKAVLHKTTALACMTFMYAMKAEGYDTCALEGFDSRRLKKLLKLPATAGITMVITCGKGAEGGVYTERFRVPSSEVIHKI